MESINIGTAPNSGNGDTLRAAMTKVNDSFDWTQKTFSHANPNLVPAVIDTVNGVSDIEDAAHIAFVARAHKLGKIRLKLLGLTGGGHSSGAKGAEMARALLDYYGAPDVPIAVYSKSSYGTAGYEVNGTYPGGVYWANHIANTGDTLFGVRANTGDHIFPDFTTEIRRIMAGSQPNSLYFAVNDPPIAILDFLQSPADDLSPLTGVQLLKRTAIRTKIMMGDFPIPTTPEYNNYINPTAASTMLSLLKSESVPIDWIGFSLGVTPASTLPTHLLVFPSGWKNADPASPLYDAMYKTSISGDIGRPAWGTVNLLTCMFDTSTLATSLYTWVSTGHNTMNPSTGANAWVASGLDEGERYLSSVNSTNIQKLIRYFTERLDVTQAVYTPPARARSVPIGSLKWGSGVNGSSATGITYYGNFDGSGNAAKAGIGGQLVVTPGSQDFTVSFNVPENVRKAVTTMTFFAATVSDSYNVSVYDHPYIDTTGTVMGPVTVQAVAGPSGTYYKVTWTNTWAAALDGKPKFVTAYFAANSTSGATGARCLVDVTVKETFAEDL